MNKRLAKSLTCAVVALLICLVPLGARIWLERHGALEHPDLGVVGEFVVRDQTDAALTRDQLRRSLTIVIYWPKSCINEPNCAVARTTASSVERWINEYLKPKWTEEKNSLVLGVIGEGASDLNGFDGWRHFVLKPEDGTLLPVKTDLERPWLVVVDNTLQFAACEDLGQELDFRHLERVLSKTAFDQYLGNYLANRTFMGPRRKQNLSNEK